MLKIVEFIRRKIHGLEHRSVFDILNLEHTEKFLKQATPQTS